MIVPTILKYAGRGIPVLSGVSPGSEFVENRLVFKNLRRCPALQFGPPGGLILNGLHKEKSPFVINDTVPNRLRLG